MKKITLFFTLFTALFSFSQNQSSGVIQNSISPASTILGSQEKFRFQSGLITQLDSGNDFNFTNSRWFSMGSLSTPSQMVYGLRFQLPNKALTMGYQDFGDRNPRIQWIGGSSNLEFRAADDFESTNSQLVATMTGSGSTFFGIDDSFRDTKVGVNYDDLSSAEDNAIGLFLKSNTSDFKFRRKFGIRITTSGATERLDSGIDINLSGSRNTTGINSAVILGNNGITYGVRSSVFGPGTPDFAAAIYGSAPTTQNTYAGYFNGNVVVNGMFTSSDRKLKEEIKKEENILSKITKLKAVNYRMKSNNKLNLSQNLQHGFIAQEVEKVFPELVTMVKSPIYKDEELVEFYEYKAVNYMGLVSILTSAVQELAARDSNINLTAYSDLTKRIKSLEKEIEDMKAKSIDNLSDLSIDKTGFSMKQNVPNPFRNQTTVNYSLPNNTGNASIMVFNMSGKFVKSYKLTSNQGNVEINSSDLGKGMFLYTLTVDNQEIITKRMIVN